MRKSTIFISSVLTTFALVMLYGVVKAYQNNMALKEAEAAVQPSETVNALVPTDVPTPTPTILTLEDAAQLAAQVVGHDNLLSAETSNFNGVDAYLIKFTNNDVVYVDLNGQMLSVQVAPVFVNVAPPANQNNNQNNNNRGEDHDDHEEHDD